MLLSVLSGNLKSCKKLDTKEIIINLLRKKNRFEKKRKAKK